MSIIFGGDAGIQETPFSGFADEISSTFSNVLDTITNSVTTGPPPPPKENVHVDNGFSNVPGTSFPGSTIDNVDDIKQRRITSQEPQLTVYVKKRAFWGLSDQNDPRFMDDGEKLFMRASKLLFEKKCAQISSYEALTKLSKLVAEDSHLDAAQIDLVREFVKDVISGFSSINGGKIDKAVADHNHGLADRLRAEAKLPIEKARKVEEALYNISKRANKLKQATNTTWVIDPDQTDIFDVGRGSGVIELTLVSQARTSLSLEGDSGSFNFTIQDPYNLTKITYDDIEVTLNSVSPKSKGFEGRDTSNSFKNEGPSLILERARLEEEKLRLIRKNKIADAFGFDRTLVGGSKASEIIFEINASGSKGDAVVAYMTSIDVPPFNGNNFRIAMLQLPVEEQLTIEEDRLVGNIFSLLGGYVTAINNLSESRAGLDNSEDVRYARRMLRLHYLGKSIVQPMDSIHIYMRGNTVKQDQIIGPLSSILSSSSFLQSANDQDVTDAVLLGEMKQLKIDQIDLPLVFYKSIRTGSFMRNAGIHVFGGVVSSVSEAYSADGGSYTLDVSGESNMKWLELSRVNKQPSLSQPQGMLSDPLTPHKIEVDKTTGLIKGEPKLLDLNQKLVDKGFMFNDSGDHHGLPVTENTLYQDSVPIGDNSQRKLKHAPGMVYKWKQGVMVATLNVNLARSLDGSPDTLHNVQRYMGLSNIDDPFAGQDGADVVSLLVTGYPHSEDRFFENSRRAGTFSADGSNSSASFFHSFFDITRSTNRTLGRFEPYREIESEGDIAVQRTTLQRSLTERFRKLDALRLEVAELSDQLLLMEKEELIETPTQAALPKSRANAVQRLTTDLATATADWDKEKAAISKLKKEAEDKNLIKNVANIGLRLAEIPSGLDDDAQDEHATNARTKNKLLQLRLQYDCKFNSDRNLFIVSDKYNNDNDIQAFVVNLKSSQSLFQSDYRTPIEICRDVAKTLDFEFYCDSQGHIRFRPPQYNRVPLSLVLKMFLLNRGGVQIYPDFLTSLFNTKLESLKNELENIKELISVHAALLGLKVLDGEKVVKKIEEGLTEENITGRLFFKKGDSSDETDEDVLADKIVTSWGRIKLLTGKTSYLSDRDNALEQVKLHNDPSVPNVNSYRLKTLNQLKTLVGRYQEVFSLHLKLKSKSTKYEYDAKDFSKEKLGKMLSPFQDLIEDDFNDFLGPGSSKRFIINDDQIIDYSFTESDQNVESRVDVNGEEDLLGAGEGALVPGIPSIWAGATDFDMWRMYGYRSEGSYRKPYLKDADTQCAPYALFLLSRARRDVVRGTVTVYGNEYYQVGDVVYINSRDMLFYVTKVTQNFSYAGASFTTSLDLRYGHPLGEYIPSPLDVIGKAQLRSNEAFNKILVSREENSRINGIHIGFVVFQDEDEDTDTDSLFKKMLSGPLANINLPNLINSLTAARNWVESDDKDSFPKVEVRGWYFSKDTERDKGEEITAARMSAVSKWLQNPSGIVPTTGSEEGTILALTGEFELSKLNPNEIMNNIPDKIGPVDLSNNLIKKKGERRPRSPSQEVYNAATKNEGNPRSIIEIVIILDDN